MYLSIIICFFQDGEFGLAWFSVAWCTLWWKDRSTAQDFKWHVQTNLTEGLKIKLKLAWLPPNGILIFQLISNIGALKKQTTSCQRLITIGSKQIFRCATHMGYWYVSLSVALELKVKQAEKTHLLCWLWLESTLCWFYFLGRCQHCFTHRPSINT